MNDLRDLSEESSIGFSENQDDITSKGIGGLKWIQNQNNLSLFCTLTSTTRYKSIMTKVCALLTTPDDNVNPPTHYFEYGPTARLLLECNQLAVDIDNEIESSIRSPGSRPKLSMLTTMRTTTVQR